MKKEKIIEKLSNNWFVWFIILVVVILFGSIIWDHYVESIKSVCLCHNESNDPSVPRSETLGCFEIKDIEQYNHNQINCDDVCSSFDLDVGCWAVYT